MGDNKAKIVRITTVPLSLEKLLEGQLSFMQQHFQVTAISADKERLEKFGKDNGVATKHIDLTRKITLLKDLKAVYNVYKYLRKEKPTIVHTHTPKAGIIGMLASFFARVPLRLHTVAGLPLMEARGIKRIILNTVEIMTYRCATMVYPNSKGLKDFILQEKFVTPSKLKILGKGSSNGIDTSYFDPSTYNTGVSLNLKVSLGIARDDFVFIFVGRMVGDKGINELVKAFVNFQKVHSHTSLLLVGPLETELDPLNEYTLMTIKNHPKIIHTGYQVDVRPYFAFAKALVFPSYREGFPNVVLQAGAMGLPSIVTNINGCNEIIKSGYNGIIIKVKDQLDIEEALERLYLDKKLFKKLQQNTRLEIVSSYQRSEFWNLLLNEYNNLIKSL